MAPDALAALQADTITAFNLAEEYQCPVVLLSDMQLSLGNQTLDEPETEFPPIRRGKLAGAESLPDLPKNQYYKRYQLTRTGFHPVYCQELRMAFTTSPVWNTMKPVVRLKRWPIGLLRRKNVCVNCKM